MLKRIIALLLIVLMVLTFCACGDKVPLHCDRCGKEFENPVEVPYEIMLAEELENGENDDILLLENCEVDLGELAESEFILGMDTKTLCSEDCKGLCCQCGANLNEGPCNCKKELDPRWAALAKLLEE